VGGGGIEREKKKLSESGRKMVMVGLTIVTAVVYSESNKIKSEDKASCQLEHKLKSRAILVFVSPVAGTCESVCCLK
jgi:hypothetical protein